MNADKLQTDIREAMMSVKEEYIEKLRLLLDVPGCETSWSDVRNALHLTTLRCLVALEYRIRAARKEAYDDGVSEGKNQ